MVTTLAEVLITVMGIEKVIPTWQDFEVFLQLLPRSSTAELMNPYTSIWTGVADGDGPSEFHLVLLDNGRTHVLADEVGRQTLNCIRCSACLNICPVYERTGGHAYGSVYPGPIAPTGTDARGEILARVRGALSDARVRERAPVSRHYERGRRDPRLLDLLAERLTDYGARVERTARSDIGEVAAGVCEQLRLGRLVVAPGVPKEWRPHGVELVDDGAGVDPRQLDKLDGVLSGCAVAIAETGTIVLDGGLRSGRRAITLVPDHHICVVEAEQVEMLVPEAFARVEQAVRDRRAQVTLISGPSATSDIELSRVEGVHGPRTLVVVLAE